MKSIQKTTSEMTRNLGNVDRPGIFFKHCDISISVIRIKGKMDEFEVTVIDQV